MTTLTHQRIFYKSLPKIELHRHMEGSLRLTTMLEIAREFKLDLPYHRVDEFRALVQVLAEEPFTFQNFLSKFTTLRNFYQSPEVIKRITRETIADAAVDNIRYLELRFTPVALTRVKDFPLGEAMDWVIETVDEIAEDYGVPTNLIASVNRHESLELAEEVIQLSIDRKDKGIIAVDLAGGESDFPGNNFKPVFKEAKEAGMRITIHAGEWGPAENIKLAIEDLGAERIGHGVRVLEDEDVVKLAIERGVTFEVCPTSNYQSGVVTSLKDHPLPKMMEAGLDVTINTDDPSISQIDLSDEYELTVESLKVERRHLQDSILNAAKASFLPEHENSILVDALAHEFKEQNRVMGLK